MGLSSSGTVKVLAGYTRASFLAEGAKELPKLDSAALVDEVAAKLRESAAARAESGMPLDTPVGIVENGYMPEQRVTIGTLATIADQAEAAGVANPAVIVIGDVVRVSPFAPEHFKTADYSTLTPNKPRVVTP